MAVYIREEAAREAARHRAELDAVTFIAITGSCGKTTAKHLAEGILGATLRGTTNPGSTNCGEPLVDNIRSVSATDDFCLQELGAWGPGTLDAGLALLQPSIGVVLNIRRDHLSAFRTLANTQAEKAKVVAWLPASGTAILNLDDPLVDDMRSMTAARTLTLGRSAGADLRATGVAARWPDRLTFGLTYDGSTHLVETRLVGEQSLGSALAAIGVAVAMGLPVGQAVHQVAHIEPPERRMSPVTLADGITFIRDDFKAPSDSLEEAVRFMAEARAPRKVLVMGRISDCPGRSRPTYEAFARAAMGVVDELVFVGERADSLWGRGRSPWSSGPSEPPTGRARVSMFGTVEAASQALRQKLRAGDLVLLKGSGPADHLERILHDHNSRVGCWLTDCGRVEACDECDLLHVGARRH